MRPPLSLRPISESRVREIARAEATAVALLEQAKVTRLSRRRLS